MNLILGFCRHWESVQGLLMATIIIQVQCPVLLLVIWLQFELVCDDTVLMMPESHACVGGEGMGELVVWLVEFTWIRACVKGELPDHADQQKCKPIKECAIMVIACMLNVIPVLKDNMSKCTTSVSCWIT